MKSFGGTCYAVDILVDLNIIGWYSVVCVLDQLVISGCFILFDGGTMHIVGSFHSILSLLPFRDLVSESNSNAT